MRELGIEPGPFAWQAKIIPLNHPRISLFVVSKRHKFLPTIPVRNKQRGPRLNPVILKALKNKTRFGSRPFLFGINAVRATKTLAQLSKPS
ncbi:hypothetical protein G6F68_011351 [Rhizopus microsporus]|nr:hypothetical protein G6F67_009442 [Rhizopus microsporus]KAG1253415.1 hypothetical protein G6F68_011351 [Rhizopus microsporus]